MPSLHAQPWLHALVLPSSLSKAQLKSPPTTWPRAQTDHDLRHAKNVHEGFGSHLIRILGFPVRVVLTLLISLVKLVVDYPFVQLKRMLENSLNLIRIKNPRRLDDTLLEPASNITIQMYQKQ